MNIRVLEEGWRHQYERMRRSRARLDTLRSSIDYDDTFYHAVQDVWHLKDWVRNDTALGSQAESIAGEAENDRALLIIADLANCTKHLVLRNTREGAAMMRSNSTVSLLDGSLNRRIDVQLLDGSTHSGDHLLDQAIAAWERILGSYKLM